MDRIQHTVLHHTRAKARHFWDFLTTETTVPRAIGSALGLVTGAALLLYTVALIVLVAFKWESSNAGMQQQNYDIDIPAHIPLDQAALAKLLQNPDATHRHLNQQLARYQDVIARHQDNFQNTRRHHDALHLAMEEAAVPLQIPKLMRSHVSTKMVAQRTPQLMTLLQALPDKLPDVYPTPEQLHEGIQLAIQELDELCRDETTPWDQVTSWLEKPYWKSFKWHNFEGSRYCPASAASATIGNASLSADDQALVDELVQSVRVLLQERDLDEVNNPWKTALYDTRQELEQFYQEKVAIAFNQLKYLGNKYKRSLKKKLSAAAESSVAAADCPVTQQTVLTMVEAGLDALYRQQDLRQAIGVSASSSGLEEDSHVILDAVLDEPWKPPRAPYPEHVNLRHVVDKPVLKLVAQWIDNGLDLMGGYSDFVDSRIDAMTGGRDDFGQVLMEYLLELSEKVNVPVPLKIQTKKMAEKTT